VSVANDCGAKFMNFAQGFGEEFPNKQALSVQEFAPCTDKCVACNLLWPQGGGCLFMCVFAWRAVGYPRSKWGFSWYQKYFFTAFLS